MAGLKKERLLLGKRMGRLSLQKSQDKGKQRKLDLLAQVKMSKYRQRSVSSEVTAVEALVEVAAVEVPVGVAAVEVQRRVAAVGAGNTQLRRALLQEYKKKLQRKQEGERDRRQLAPMETRTEKSSVLAGTSFSRRLQHPEHLDFVKAMVPVPGGLGKKGSIVEKTVQGIPAVLSRTLSRTTGSKYQSWFGRFLQWLAESEVDLEEVSEWTVAGFLCYITQGTGSIPQMQAAEECYQLLHGTAGEEGTDGQRDCERSPKKSRERFHTACRAKAAIHSPAYPDDD